MIPISSLPANNAAALGGLSGPASSEVERLFGKGSTELSHAVDKTSVAQESFGSMVEHFVSGVDDKMRTARADQGKVLTGETTSLHQAMISMQEASVAFSLMTEVRNKLVESYQEMMRMQV